MDIWNRLIKFKGTEEEEKVKKIHLSNLNTAGGRELSGQEAENWLNNTILSKMYVVIVNNYRWHYSYKNHSLYENAESEPIKLDQFTSQEQAQIKDQLKYRIANASK